MRSSVECVFKVPISDLYTDTTISNTSVVHWLSRNLEIKLVCAGYIQKKKKKHWHQHGDQSSKTEWRNLHRNSPGQPWPGRAWRPYAESSQWPQINFLHKHQTKGTTRMDTTSSTITTKNKERGEREKKRTVFPSWANVQLPPRMLGDCDQRRAQTWTPPPPHPTPFHALIRRVN